MTPQRFKPKYIACAKDNVERFGRNECHQFFVDLDVDLVQRVGSAFSLLLILPPLS